MTNESLLDATLLQTFHTVARLGSVTEAARALHRSQPAVSHRLRSLEEELGVRLFEKSGRGLRLSVYGRRLLSASADYVALSRQIRGQVLDEAVSGEVVIGTLPTLAAHWMAPALVALLECFPELRIQVRTGMVQPIGRQLRDGQLDLAVVAGRPVPDGLQAEQVGRTGVVAIFAPDKAPRASGQVSLNELAQRRYLAWEGMTDPTFDAVRKYIEEAELSRTTAARVPNIETLRVLSASGAGYSLIPTYTARQDVQAGRLVALEPEGLDLEVPILCLTRAGAPSSPGVEAVIEAFRQLR